MPQQPPQPNKPTQKKDETLKYELTYANGGFNDGVEIKPAKQGKVELTISLYGGGEIRKMLVGPPPPELAKLLQAYEAGTTNEKDTTPEITGELQRQFDDMKVRLSMTIIEILQEADSKIETAIKTMFRANKNATV